MYSPRAPKTNMMQAEIAMNNSRCVHENGGEFHQELLRGRVHITLTLRGGGGVNHLLTNVNGGRGGLAHVNVSKLPAHGPVIRQ